jgi:hypothetical protein
MRSLDWREVGCAVAMDSTFACVSTGVSVFSVMTRLVFSLAVPAKAGAARWACGLGRTLVEGSSTDFSEAFNVFEVASALSGAGLERRGLGATGASASGGGARLALRLLDGLGPAVSATTFGKVSDLPMGRRRVAVGDGTSVPGVAPSISVFFFLIPFNPFPVFLKARLIARPQAKSGP